MKKLLFILILLLPVLTACNANIVGKFEDYNEVFSGTIDLDMQGTGIISVKSVPSGISCKGEGFVTYVPLSSTMWGTCKGQRGKALLTCDDGRNVSGEWICESCTRIKGRGITNLNEKVSFYITPSKKKSLKKIEEYKNETKMNPNLKKYNATPQSIMEELF